MKPTSYPARLIAFFIDFSLILYVVHLVSDSMVWFFLVFASYRTVFDRYLEGSIGRWVMRYQIVDRLGDPPTLGWLFFRHWLWPFWLLALIPCRVNPAVGHQTLLDTFCGTSAVEVEPINPMGRFFYRNSSWLAPLAILLSVFMLYQTL